MKITEEKFRQALSELKKVQKEFPEFDVLAATVSGDMWEHMSEQQKEELRKQCPVAQLVSASDSESGG